MDANDLGEQRARNPTLPAARSRALTRHSL